MKDWTEVYISPRPRSWIVGAGDCPPRGAAQMDRELQSSTFLHAGTGVGGPRVHRNVSAVGPTVGNKTISEHRCSHTLIVTCILSHTNTAHALSPTCTHTHSCALCIHPCTLTLPHAHAAPFACLTLAISAPLSVGHHVSSLLDQLPGAAVTQYTGWEAQVTSIYCLTLLEARSPTARRWQDWSLPRTLRESLLQASLPGL